VYNTDLNESIEIINEKYEKCGPTKLEKINDILINFNHILDLKSQKIYPN